MSADTILHRLHQNGKTAPNNPAYYEKINGKWTATNWETFLSQVRQASRALIALGIDTGDIVTILGLNRAEWTIVDLASMAVGGACAGIYTSNSPGEVQYVVENSDSKVILVEDKGQWDKIDAERANLPKLETIVMMKGADVPDDAMTLSWEAFLAKADEVDEATLDARLDALDMEQLATLIYTSGTTGPPKGVMLSHKNLAWTAKMASGLFNMSPNESSLSYLPLSHIAEQMFTIHSPITAGYPIYYAEYDGSIPNIAGNLKEIQPTIIFGVPRVWERFYNGVSAKMGEAEGAKAKIAAWSREVGAEATAKTLVGKEVGGLLGLKHTVATKLVFSKLHEALGLSNARVLVSGAAPIPKYILDYFASLDLIIYEVYGQSEGSGPTTFNQLGRTKLGTVGPAIPGSEVKIAEDGEILLKGPNVFMGYYKNESATNETLTDGWLYSGDLGEFDNQGYLNITGRKKDIIITSGGKNIAPKNIEASLTQISIVGSAVVIGDDRRFLTALLTLEEEVAEKFAKDNGIAINELATSDVLKKHLDAEIEDKCNSHYARVEHVRGYTVLENPFSIEGGELTPTLKIKRAKVNTKYADTIEGMYAE